ncbi:HAD-superfamily phosphatase, subfamily IIIC containing protein, expressed [Panicum miliaceum]|uniref:HAD-superfamily phosphatase, subfamily IIIC containing protein, expressed n=1 Tax=Panicum miliaceum TaxID=4540 RepID=A0A3L6Q3T4_PANMI|nr:HAD-superfamily phosphatase, subfamily IIIC containing protein, expressed [Panicum miliaceum]
MAATAAGYDDDASEPWWRRKRPRRTPQPPEADTEAVKAEALVLMSALPVLPRLVVFDLDYTLWPFQCDRLPKDEIPYLYPQARGILNALKDKGVETAIASRASRRGVAKSFLEKLGIHFMFGTQISIYLY